MLRKKNSSLRMSKKTNPQMQHNPGDLGSYMWLECQWTGQSCSEVSHTSRWGLVRVRDVESSERREWTQTLTPRRLCLSPVSHRRRTTWRVLACANNNNGAWLTGSTVCQTSTRPVSKPVTGNRRPTDGWVKACVIYPAVGGGGFMIQNHLTPGA